jgi:hypothetical protein
MVFDECHHTRKNHPYNCILREYFQVHPSSLRPKIFGMTASPIWNTKNPMSSLAELEANMDAKVIAIREHVNELAEHAPKPSEVVFLKNLDGFNRISDSNIPRLSRNTHSRPKNMKITPLQPYARPWPL